MILLKYHISPTLKEHQTSGQGGNILPLYFGTIENYNSVLRPSAGLTAISHQISNESKIQIFQIVRISGETEELKEELCRSLLPARSAPGNIHSTLRVTKCVDLIHTSNRSKQLTKSLICLYDKKLEAGPKYTKKYITYDHVRSGYS